MTSAALSVAAMDGHALPGTVIRPAGIGVGIPEDSGRSDLLRLESARAQAQIFERVGVRLEFVREALVAIDESARTVVTDTSSKSAAQKPAPPDRVLLFTGHMIDAADRKSPRFPPTARPKQKPAA